jgi:hypothetical protein
MVVAKACRRQTRINHPYRAMTITTFLSHVLRGPVAGLATALLIVAASPAGAADTIDPAHGRISWRVDQQSGFATQYARQTNHSSICDVGIWDNQTYFAKVTFCETVSGWYWKPAYLSFDLMMEDFSQLQDFITAGPEPFRDVVTSIGTVSLYGFNVDQTPEGAPWQCVAFIKGFGHEDRGYQQMLLAYFCDDTGQGMSDGRLEEALAGLTIERVFDRLAD